MERSVVEHAEVVKWMEAMLVSYIRKVLIDLGIS